MSNNVNTNNVALITGSSRGIGFQIAKEFEKRNICTILTGRSQTRLNRALEEINPEKNLAFSVDFSKENDVDTFLESLLKKQVIPNILVHNFGGRIEGDDFPINRKILKTSIEINLEVAIKITEKFLPFMIEKKFGRIIHIGSDASLTGQASPAYVIAKSALNGYVKTSARYYAKNNIMLCAVLPGIIEHEDSEWANKKIIHPEHYKKKLNQTSLGRFGKPEEIAGFVAELAVSDSMMCAGGLFEFRGAMS